jgi:hypothetical protein
MHTTLRLENTKRRNQFKNSGVDDLREIVGQLGVYLLVLLVYRSRLVEASLVPQVHRSRRLHCNDILNIFFTNLIALLSG